MLAVQGLNVPSGSLPCLPTRHLSEAVFCAHKFLFVFVVVLDTKTLGVILYWIITSLQYLFYFDTCLNYSTSVEAKLEAVLKDFNNEFHISHRANKQVNQDICFRE